MYNKRFWELDHSKAGNDFIQVYKEEQGFQSMKCRKKFCGGNEVRQIKIKVKMQVLFTLKMIDKWYCILHCWSLFIYLFLTKLYLKREACFGSNKSYF